MFGQNALLRVPESNYECVPMNQMGIKRWLRRLLPASLLFYLAVAFAQTDEIQVYDASIADVGEREFTLHSNYTPVGRTSAAYPGGIVPDHSVNGAFEFAYGLRDYWELGLYLPVYTVTNEGTVEFDGAKVRTLWVVPHAREKEFFYGLNVEYSYNLPHWDTARWTLEARPIVGCHEGPWDLIFNPILDSSFDGIGQTHFAPAARLAYNATDRWALGLETYSDFGPIQRSYDWEQQSQTFFAVVDYASAASSSIEIGVGHGFTSASDEWIVKLIWNHAF